MNRIRRALLSVSDKTGIVDIARALSQSGAELVATGKTADLIRAAGLSVTPIEQLTGTPEAFQGRMKTLSFPVCSGILYRRGDEKDEADMAALGFKPIDCVVVNFYPFENSPGIETIDIGGPTLVRSAAKNSKHVLVLTDPTQYPAVIEELSTTGGIGEVTSVRLAETAWKRISEYDQAIYTHMSGTKVVPLRYGENPHQRAILEVNIKSPIAWTPALTSNELSYNNIVDISSAYALACDLKALNPEGSGVVIVKHNNPCGVALVPKGVSQLRAVELAWEGDSISAFGGVIVLTDPLREETARWLSEKFIECLAAPNLDDSAPLQEMILKRKKLKAVSIRRFSAEPMQTSLDVPGGRLTQTADTGLDERFECKTKKEFSESQLALAKFGVAVCRALKSNAIALVRVCESPHGAYQLVGAGQGQPNRIEALAKLAVPRAKEVVRGGLEDVMMVSDAFFPFRDTVDEAARQGIRWIIQPGGSIKDAESIAACDEHGVAMMFTGRRHFRH